MPGPSPAPSGRLACLSLKLLKALLPNRATRFMAGLPPHALACLTTCRALDFAGGWERRELAAIDALPVRYLFREDPVEAKQRLGRDQDRVDLRWLEREGN
jgi:hypothetical protein